MSDNDDNHYDEDDDHWGGDRGRGHNGDDQNGDDANADKPKKPRKGDYVVGYKRPPKHTQYKPGESGNRKGRNKGSKNTATLLAEELNKRTSVTENGKQQRITKRHVIVKRSVHTAMIDAKIAIPFLQQVLRSEGSGEQSKAPVPIPSGPEQDRIIEEFLRAARASAEPHVGTPEGDDEDDKGVPGGDA